MHQAIQHAARLRIEHAVTWDHHRGGWKQGVSWLYRHLHSDDGTLFIPSVDEFLVSGRVLREPWVGVIHGAPRTFYRFPDLERLLAMDTFKANARWCRGLWALSHYVSGYLKSREVPFLVGTLPYAVDHDVEPFSFAAFKAAAPRRLLLVGEYLRRYDRFYALAAPGYTKLLLRCFPDGETQRHLRSEHDVTVLDRIGDTEYDAWLRDSILFLDLVDAPATTAICECIARSTPVLVNRVGAVEEYLGADYPLYFADLDDAAAKLQDLDLIARAVTHLRRRRRQLDLTFERFVDRVATSAIYRALPIPQSRAGAFQRRDLTVLVCSYRRTHNLRRLLQSLCHQTYRGAIEVIVWNNNADAVDAVNEAVAPLRSQLDLTVIHSDRNFYCTVRLAVPHLMSSERLMICDDDVLPGADYLQTFVSALEAAGARSVICARGHTFAPHQLDVDHPEAVWDGRHHLQFWDQTTAAREVHFMHADNCLIPRAALLELAACPLPRPQFALVDDYWMSMTLARDLAWKLWKIEAGSAFTFDRSADDRDIALYRNPAVQEQRIDFYVHHMLAGWPGPADAECAVRGARVDDIVSLVDLERRGFGPNAYTGDGLRQLIESGEDTRVLVATDRDEIVACAVAQTLRLDRAVPGSVSTLCERCGIQDPSRAIGYLKSLVVAEDHRRRGLGTALTRARLQWLAERGIRHVFAFAWPGGHCAALAARLGFTCLGTWPTKTYADGSVATLFHRVLDD